LVTASLLAACGNSAKEASVNAGKAPATAIFQANYGALNDAMATTITVSPTKFGIGEYGAIEISLTNSSSFTVALQGVHAKLAPNFFDGLLIDYPTAPPQVEIRKGIDGPSVWFADILLRPQQGVTLTIPIVAFAPGDYSGDYTIAAESASESEIEGRLLEGQWFDVIVLPQQVPK
jgi:hypothetical protein